MKDLTERAESEYVITHGILAVSIEGSRLILIRITTLNMESNTIHKSDYSTDGRFPYPNKGCPLLHLLKVRPFHPCLRAGIQPVAD